MLLVFWPYPLFTLISLFTVTSVSNFLTYLFSIQAIPVFLAYPAINSGIGKSSVTHASHFSYVNNATNRSISLAAAAAVLVVVVVATFNL